MVQTSISLIRGSAFRLAGQARAAHGPDMPAEAILFFRIVAATAFFTTLLATYFVIRNSHRLFGGSAHSASENSSTRLYAKFLVYAALAHALVLSASFALMLH